MVDDGPLLREWWGPTERGNRMFFFTRQATPMGSPREIMAYATETTDLVNSKVDTTTTLWQNLFGAPVGTLLWNTLVRSRAQLGQTMMTIMADDDIQRQLEKGLEFASDKIATQDFLVRFLFGEREELPSVGHVAEAVSAVAAPHRMADAMAWGPVIAKKVGQIGGTTPSFWTSAYGTVGQIMWMTVYPSLEALDEAQDRLQSNEEYLGEVAKGMDLFVEGSGQRASAMRVH